VQVKAFRVTVIAVRREVYIPRVLTKRVDPEHLPGHLVVLSGRVISGRGKVTPRENEKASA
jgi:hypothetical protein